VKNRMTLRILSLPENVALARVAVATFVSSLELTLNEIEELKVAVSEAVTNAIVHGYGAKGRGEVTISAQIIGRDLTVVVEDQGRGIEDVELARQPSYSTDPERMGLGFVFMDSFMDRLEVESKPGEGTRVTMYKHYEPRPAAGEASAGVSGKG